MDVGKFIATSFEESGLVTIVEVGDSATMVHVSLMHPTNIILTPVGQAFTPPSAQLEEHLHERFES